jgi:hypothetical protein
MLFVNINFYGNIGPPPPPPPLPEEWNSPLHSPMLCGASFNVGGGLPPSIVDTDPPATLKVFVIPLKVLPVIKLDKLKFVVWLQPVADCISPPCCPIPKFVVPIAGKAIYYSASLTSFN